MKKLVCLALSLAMALSIAACGGGAANSSAQGSAPESGTQAPAEGGQQEKLSGKIVLDGSTSMEKVIGALSESFMLEHQGVSITAGGSGSGGGIAAILNGTVDMGMASRELKQEEKDKGAQAHTIALDGVAIIVNKENPVADLTVEQIAKLFTGEIANWSELGGEDAPVAALGREPGSGTRGAFEEILGVTDSCKYQAEYSSTGDMIGNVASNPYAIGYASLSAVNDTVSAVDVNGVACTEATVLDSSYPIQRPFLLVTKQGVELSRQSQAFLDHALSAGAADLIAQAGAVSPNG